jgi:hypothetical protein
VAGTRTIAKQRYAVGDVGTEHPGRVTAHRTLAPLGATARDDALPVGRAVVPFVADAPADVVIAAEAAHAAATKAALSRKIRIKDPPKASQFGRLPA